MASNLTLGSVGDQILQELRPQWHEAGLEKFRLANRHDASGKVHVRLSQSE